MFSSKCYCGQYKYTFDKSAEKFSQYFFCCKYKKSWHMCFFMFFLREKCSSEHVNWSFDKFAYFFSITQNSFNQNSRKEIKQIFEKASSPQIFIVDKTNTLLTGLPKSFSQIFFSCKYDKTKHLGNFKRFHREEWSSGHIKGSFNNLAEFVLP